MSDSVEYKLQPYKYQFDVINFGKESLIKNGYAALLLEMGLGKTKCSLHIAEHLKNSVLIDSLIILCPKALVSVWEEQPNIHTYLEYTQLIWDSTRIKTKTYQKEVSNFLYEKDKFKIFIINIEAFQAKNKELDVLIKSFISNHNSLCVLDESTKIKSPKANRSKNILKFAESIKYKVILTGTEVTNSVLDLYNQYEFLKKGFWNLKNFYVFRARYAIMIDIKTNTGSFPKIVGYQKVDDLINRITPYSIRLKKKDCLDLPEKIYAEIKVEMNPEQKRVYQELKKKLMVEYKERLLIVKNKVSLFIRFRQIAGGYMPETGEPIGSRNEKLIALLEDVESYDGKVVIFSSFTAEIEHITNELINAYGKESTVCFTGLQSSTEKDNSLEQFKNNDACRFIVINSQSGAFGLNLQNASLAYYFSRPLSIEQNLQSEDRLHRIGQKNNVVYKDLIVKDSIDERIQKLLSQKVDLINKFQNMTIEDCFSLI